MDNDLKDRLAIREVLDTYATAIDTRDWALLDRVFAPGAVVDYTSSGGRRSTYPEVAPWLAKALEPFTMTQHVITNHRITVDGDTASTRCYLFNPMGIADPEGGEMHLFFIGGHYDDHLHRTEHGWRITERVLHVLWLDGKIPDFLPQP